MSRASSLQTPQSAAAWVGAAFPWDGHTLPHVLRSAFYFRAEIASIWENYGLGGSSIHQLWAACGKAVLSGELVLDGEANQVGARPDAEGLHRAVLVELDRPRGDAEDCRDLLHAVSLSEKLRNLSLAG